MWDKAGDAWREMPLKSKERKAALARLLEQGKVVEVHVEGIDMPLYARNKDRTTLDRTLDSNYVSPRAVLLAPLDNLLWDRCFIEALFGFDYV